MRAYRLSVNLKLGLIIFAVLIAVASLVYTDRLVDRLRAREQAIIQLWADAQAQVAQTSQQLGNPYQSELDRLEEMLRRWRTGGTTPLPPEELRAMQEAVVWAQSMPPSDELNFITNEIIIPNPFGIPAIITDSLTGEPSFWREVPVSDTLASMSPEDSARAIERLRELAAEMDEVYQPIPIVFSYPGETGDEQRLVQYVHYDESELIKELRVFPYVQLLFVGLFILVGYLGFSYVRRSEQSSLWVGMAKEAAHQLGTPISSLMGWSELLRLPDLPDEQVQQALDEIDDDIGRLQRVANRFSDIGSLPKLESLALAPLIEETADYMRRRIPRSRQVDLRVDVPDELRAPLNAELFAWVIENLLKNALDAMDGSEGMITVAARASDEGQVHVDVSDTGKGIDRRQWKNVFRPGYSTKKRGWGLGLSLAKRIIEQYHGGTLTLLQSRVDEGTTFRIVLPAVARAEDAQRRFARSEAA